MSSPRLRIDLVAPPMSGHLHPVLGIGRRLARDHDVRVISTAGAQREIVAAGLVGLTVLPGADELISSIVNPPYGVRSNPLRLHAQFVENLRLLEGLHAQLGQTWTTAAPDLVIADFTVPVAGSVATAYGIPWWTTTPAPAAMETSAGPPGYLGGLRPRAGVVGALRDRAGRLAIRTFKRGVHLLHRSRLRRIGFDSVYRDDGTEVLYSAERIIATSLERLEFARGYPPHIVFVGPVLYSPPVSLVDPPFITGRRHVLVTLGTHLGWRRAHVAAAVRQASVALRDVEFHFSDGDRSSDRQESSANFHRIGFVSYAAHLSRYDLVVHHGGTGVLGFTLAAGIPSVVYPLDYDHFDNCARLVAAGVALRLTRLPDLARLIPQALADQELRAAVDRLQADVLAAKAEERVASLVHAFALQRSSRLPSP